MIWSLKHNLNLQRDVFAKSNDFIDIFCHPKQQCCPTHSSPNIVRTEGLRCHHHGRYKFSVKYCFHMCITVFLGSLIQYVQSFPFFRKLVKIYTVIRLLVLVNECKFTVSLSILCQLYIDLSVMEGLTDLSSHIISQRYFIN